MDLWWVYGRLRVCVRACFVWVWGEITQKAAKAPKKAQSRKSQKFSPDCLKPKAKTNPEKKKKKKKKKAPPP